MTVRHRALILSLLLCGLPLAGCDFFRPADPPAVDDEQPIAQDYSSPEATLLTIELAVEAKGLSAGAVAYVGAFADSTEPGTPEFRHFFWQADEAAWTAIGNTVPNWTSDQELVFYNISPRNLINLRDEPYAMEWEPELDNPDDNGDGFVVLHRRYRIYAMGGDGTPVAIIAKGYADLTVTQLDTGDWKLTRWNDRADPENELGLEQKTWGQRRLESQ